MSIRIIATTPPLPDGTIESALVQTGPRVGFILNLIDKTRSEEVSLPGLARWAEWTYEPTEEERRRIREVLNEVV